jgi:hypothetical protein
MFAEDNIGADATAPSSSPPPPRSKAKKAPPKVKATVKAKAKGMTMTSATYTPKKGHKITWETGSRWGTSVYNGTVIAYVPAGVKAVIGSGVAKAMTEAGLAPEGTSNRDRVVVNRDGRYVFANVKAITAHA